MSKQTQQYWLLKSEAGCYGIDDLKKDKRTAWEGVRNYQARNFMTQGMAVGDLVFFYHSNGTVENPTGIYGLARVCGAAHVDKSQFDKKDEHFDPRSKQEKPLWFCVDVEFVKKFEWALSLAEIKKDLNLAGIVVAQTGSRLSVQPVAEKHGDYLVKKLS